MVDSIRDKLVSIVLRISGGKREPDDCDCLYHNLRIAGDDALELLEAVQKEFGTKFDNLNFGTYFPNEGDLMGYQLSKMFGVRDKLKRFNFGHLVEVVKSGHWYEPKEDEPK